MEFDEIWPLFDWVLDEMRSGMGFFEGYLPTIRSDLLPPLTTLIDRSQSHDFTTSTWSNDTTETGGNTDYSVPEFIEFFRSGDIVMLDFDYTVQTRALELRLMFEKDDTGTALEIICYREPILGSDNPKEAVATAISEFRYLRRLFQGDALFIGPDTLDYPESATEYPKVWLRIE